MLASKNALKEKTILNHGYAGHDLSFWLQWIEAELQKDNKEVVFPTYENSKLPKMEEWVSLIKKEVSDQSYTYTFVAHSMGSLVTLKLIESMNVTIEKVVLVACPKNYVATNDGGSLWKRVEGEERRILKTFFDQDLDFKAIQEKIPELHFFFSKDDFVIPYEAHDYYQSKFPRAHFKTFNSYGHFNRKNNIYTLPEALEIIKE